ncbi:MAG: hypothetical protein KJ607_14630, partial [Bacteroidetes bacterium]|nr:hypothetical protein [Bacteroidota bacterium]
KGSAITFNIFSSTSAEVAEGTYLYNPDDEISGTFSYSVVVINYDTQTDEADEYLYIEDGSVTFDKLGQNFVVSFSCHDETGKSVKGYFSGPLLYFY